MSAWGTDVMALACILASAAVGGVVTIMALDRDGGDAAMRGVEVVVVDVDPAVRIRLDEASVRMELARARAEAARVRVEATLEKDLQQRLEAELRRVEEELARLDEGWKR